MIDDLSVLPDTPRSYHTNLLVLSICLQGELRAIYNGVEQVFKKNQFCLLLNNQDVVYEKKGVSSDFKGEFILFSKEIGTNMIGQEFISSYLFFKKQPIISVSEEEMEILANNFQLIKKTLERKDEVNKGKMLQILHSYLREIILNSKEYKEKAPDTKDEQNMKELFVQFSKLLLKYYNQYRDVAFYADKLCITGNYLWKITNTFFGYSPKEFIKRYLIMQAKQMLDDRRDLNIKEIAMELGFPNQSEFGKFFKNATGLSPANYRKQ